MINFLKLRWLTVLFSSLIIASFIGMSLYRLQTRGDIFSYSVDFSGGTQVQIAFDKSTDEDLIKNVIVQQGWHGAAVRKLSDTEFLIRVKEFANDAKGLGERIKSALEQKISDVNITIRRSESVGAGIGQALRWKSIIAIALALFAMLAYIAYRFWSLAFATGAVAALFHDALVMLALFLFLDREISVNTIGAILAVLGYSINDTIVIFSQIRDNLREAKDQSLSEIINKSLNKTLKRTILTSISTGLPVATMLAIGGEALFDFSLVLLIGIIFGTYSSIYIASPVMMLLHKK